MNTNTECVFIFLLTDSFDEGPFANLLQNMWIIMKVSEIFSPLKVAYTLL